jgi:outer membrane protein OmpA-like peptidoglycan-associated protein
MQRLAHGMHADREFVLSATIVFVLCACAPQQTRAPPAPAPAPVQAAVEPAPPPAQLPQRSTGAVPGATAARVAVLDPSNEQQDKNRIKLALAKNSHDALGPTEVGYYMDVLQGRLKQIAGKDFGVVRQADYVILDMSFQPGFERGSVQLDSSVRDALKPLSKVLVEYRMTLVSLQVHADDSGYQSVKAGLAGRRAQALAHALVESGISGKRVVIAGSNSSDQAENNSRAEGQLRVEMRLEPIVRVSVNER